MRNIQMLGAALRHNDLIIYISANTNHSELIAGVISIGEQEDPNNFEKGYLGCDGNFYSIDQISNEYDLRVPDSER